MVKTMLTKKVLPLNTNPFIKTYPYNAFYLGILEANGFDISDILINEFFNLHCYYYKKDWHIDFCGSGFVEKNRFITKYDIKLETININQIKNKIDNNFYLMMNLNERYLGVSEIQWDCDRCHDWLIYGYNDLLNEFYCCGYINKKGVGEYYGTIKVKYNCLIKSIKKVPKTFTRFRSYKLQNHSLIIDYSFKEKVLTKNKLLNKLYNYYHPKKLVIYHKPFIFNDINGLNMYMKNFKKNYVILNKKNEIYLPDIRNIHEHKKIIKLIMEKLNCKEEIIEQQNLLIKDSYSILMLSAKHFLNPHQNTIEKIYNKLIDIEKREKEIVFKAIYSII